MNTHYNAASQVEALSYVLNTLIQSSAKESEGCVRHVRQKDLLISIQLIKKLLQQAEELAMMEAEVEAFPSKEMLLLGFTTSNRRIYESSDL